MQNNCFRYECLHLEVLTNTIFLTFIELMSLEDIW